MRTISFVNMKKTTLALNVADCLSRTHQKKVAVLDVDPQFNITQCMFTGAQYVKLLKGGADTIVNVFDTDTHSTASSVQGPATVEQKEYSDIVLQKAHNIWTLPGNIDLYRLEMVSGEGREFALKRFIEERMSGEEFDYTIIDTPPTPSVWMTSALIASDYFVIPVKPDPLSLIGIDLLRSIIERRRKSYGLTIQCLGVVFTRVDRSDSVMFAEAKDSLKSNSYWKDYLFSQYLPKRTDLARNQLSQPFILKMDDFDLRNKLMAIVEQILSGAKNG
jgi:chromosome partitioning protein